MNKAKTTLFYMCVKTGSQLGLPGSAGFRVEPPGQLPTGFLLRPGPVPCPGRPGPGSTRRAGSGFKTMDDAPNTLSIYEVTFVNGWQLRDYVAKLPSRNERISHLTLALA